ncbi:tRNA 2-thiouridine(34) synthase MnmA [bacterium]|nr:tRNA 2-thiouridine(34) synthase MnmA [bacterium]
MRRDERGGVDSSVAAYLLRREGHEVIGLTFRNWPQDCLSRADDKCCGPQAVRDARMVASALDIPHYVVDEIDEFQREVIDYFTCEYQQGRTPNPCVVCNDRIKFGSLLRKAESFGATCIATGHYARITRGGRYQLRQGRQAGKDQSYYLFNLRQDQLARVLLPLGELTKDETRQLARELDLKTYDKADSQEICFVPGEDYGRFLREEANLPDRRGEIVTAAGRVLGHHDGIQYFTIGQREGLRLGGQKEPLYVLALETGTNRVVVGPDRDLYRDEFEVDRCNWVSVAEPGQPLAVTVRIRSHHEGAAAVVETLGDGRARVHTRNPQRAVTPGQAAVFYQDDLVLGGGWIG